MCITSGTEAVTVVRKFFLENRDNTCAIACCIIRSTALEYLTALFLHPVLGISPAYRLRSVLLFHKVCLRFHHVVWGKAEVIYTSSINPWLPRSSLPVVSKVQFSLSRTFQALPVSTLFPSSSLLTLEHNYALLLTSEFHSCIRG